MAPLDQPASDEGAHRHYLNLSGAALVPTTATRITHAHLHTVIKARGIMCIYGRVGLGKTVAVETTLRDMAPRSTVRTTASKLPRIREILYHQMGLPGDPPAKITVLEQALQHALCERPWVMVCDEAQKLDTKAFDFYRELWDDPGTQLTLVFVGSDNCNTKIRARPALASRVTLWQQFTPLKPAEVATVIPQYHPLWGNAAVDDILWADDTACHGNFRNWAKLTYLLQEALRETSDTPDRRLIHSVLKGMSSPRYDD